MPVPYLALYASSNATANLRRGQFAHALAPVVDERFVHAGLLLNHLLEASAGAQNEPFRHVTAHAVSDSRGSKIVCEFIQESRHRKEQSITTPPIPYPLNTLFLLAILPRGTVFVCFSQPWPAYQAARVACIEARKTRSRATDWNWQSCRVQL
jgi:hypothetical protein